MLSRLTKAALCAALLLISTAPLFAQAWAGRGRLQGTVNDENGKPLEGAKVTLRPGNDTVKAENPGPSPLTTKKDGRWTILGLGGGTWGVLIEKDGYIPSEGRVQVDEFSPSKPVIINLKVIPKEQVQKAQEESKGGQALKALNEGNAFLQADQYAQARESYEKAMALLDPPNQPPVLRAIASTYYKESAAAKNKDEKAAKLDQSIATLKQALALKPDDADTLQLLINVLVGAGRETEAQPYMAQLPAGTKVDPDALINIGIKYYNAKQLDKALDAFNRVVTENPEMGEAYYYRGLVFLNKGKVPEAKADFQKLIEIDPKSPHAAEARDFLKNL